MPYDAVANGLTPALIIYLMDVSASMNQAFEGTTRIAVVNQAIETVLRRMARLSLKGADISPRYQLAMIAYSDTPMDIIAGVKTIDKVIALGRPVLQTFDRTDTAAAFKIAQGILERELPKRRGLQKFPAPMVCHLTDGEFNGDDPEPIAREIMGMTTDDGNVLVENIFVGPNLLHSPIIDPHQWSGIQSSSDLQSEYAKKLFNMSSALPASYADGIERAGFSMTGGSRMLIPGSTSELIELAFVMSGATPIGETPRLSPAHG